MKLLSFLLASIILSINACKLGRQWLCDEMSAGAYIVNNKCDNIKMVIRYVILHHESSNEYDKALASVSCSGS